MQISNNIEGYQVEIEIYNWLLVHKTGEWEKQWNKKSIEKPRCGDLKNYEWIKWGKELPGDKDTVDYRYENGQLIKVE